VASAPQTRLGGWRAYTAPVSNTLFQEQIQLTIDSDWLELLNQCHTCSMILQDIETLDLALLCDPMHVNDEDHWEMHRYGLSPVNLSAVLRWLRVSFIHQLNESRSIFRLAVAIPGSSTSSHCPLGESISPYNTMRVASSFPT
jgi:hypothetical protein